MTRPNVLLISVDDMNDWVGCIGGYPAVLTPNIDALANRGVAFTNAHCPSPLCNPSRSAILTGRAPHRSGVYSNDHWWRPTQQDVVTLPEHLRANGYTTACAGKVFHHTDGFNPPDQWDEILPMIWDDPWDRVNYRWVKDEPVPDWHPMNGLEPYFHETDWGPIAKPWSEWGDVQAIEWASRFLDRDHEKPFFLAVGTFRPHIPWYAPPRYFDRYPRAGLRMPRVFDSDLENLPEGGQTMAAFKRNEYEKMVDGGEWENAVQAYLACISFTDEMIGQLIGALDASPHAEDTAIVFYSDNGYHLGEKKHFTKCTLWERSTHVPFIVVPPGRAPRTRLQGAAPAPLGERSGAEVGPASTAAWRPSVQRRSVNLQDIYPTVLDMCGLDAPDSGIDGESLLPNIVDPMRPIDRPAITTYLRGNHAVRIDEWRYIRYEDGGEELYHTSEDPDERDNLADDGGYVALRRDLASFVPAESAEPVAGKKAFDFDYDSYSWTPRLEGP